MGETSRAAGNALKKRYGLFGLGALACWMFLMAGYLGSQSAFGENPGVLMFAFAFSTGVALVAWYLLPAPVSASLGDYRTARLGSACMTLGTLALVGTPVVVTEAFAFPVALVLSALLGVAAAALGAYWGIQVSRFRLEQFGAIVAFGVAVGAALALAGLLAAPIPVLAAACVLAPLLQLPFIAICTRFKGGRAVDGTSEQKLSRKVAGLFSGDCEHDLFFTVPCTHGFVYGLFFYLVVGGSGVASGYADLGAVGCLATALGIGAGASAYFKRLEFEVVHRPILVMFFPLCLFAPFMFAEGGGLAVIGGVMGLTSFFLVLFISACDTCNVFREDLSLAIGVKNGTGLIFILLGVLAGYALAEALAPNAYAVAAVYALGCVVLFATSLYDLDLHQELEARLLPEDVGPLALQWFCEHCVERYGLTSREAEVLGLLAAGRDASRIEESLNITYATVRTHIRKIYRKLQIHSRQELLDLIESSASTKAGQKP